MTIIRTDHARAVTGDALRQCTVATPIGPLLLVASDAGLRAVLWPGEDGGRIRLSLDAVPRISARAQNLRGAAEIVHRGGDSAGPGTVNPATPATPATVDQADDPTRNRCAAAPAPGAADRHLAAAAQQLTEYFAGSRRTFDVALDPVGTPFQLRAWEALRAIPYGHTMSYGEQAVVLGDPRKARAVGGANRRNPISVIVPCHRVVGVSGALTGFAGGLDTKAWLLAHEQRVLADG